MPEPPIMKNKSLVLLSGGLDSGVTLALAAQKSQPIALTFDYGQKALKRELKASQKIAQFYGAEHLKVKIDWLSKISDSALLDKNKKIPAIFKRKSCLKDSKKKSSKVWVANRNGLFINIAAVIAESLKIPTILAGFNREEARNFPDNSRNFIKAANRAFHYSTRGKVKLRSFLINLDKTEIVKLALKIKFPLHLIWPCYLAGSKFCGLCESCCRVKIAFKKNGQFLLIKKLFYA